MENVSSVTPMSDPVLWSEYVMSVIMEATRWILNPSSCSIHVQFFVYFQGRCVICGGPGISDAYYCKECTIQEKDRDGCPKIVNLGSSKTDLFYEMKKYGFKKR